MRQLLILHPDSRCFAVAKIEVGGARPRADSLVLSYIVTGKMSNVRMPPAMAAARSDELWRHTCFEAFVRASSGAEYYEFNFAPSTRLIGTIRREFLDHVLIWNAIDLERKLDEFRIYYNENRVHQSLSGSTPRERSGEPPPAHAVLDHYAWRHHCRGLFQMPIAA